MCKKIIVFLIAALMLLTAGCGAESASVPSEEPVETPAERQEELPAEPTLELSDEEPAEAPVERPAPAPGEASGDLVILYTSDVHCAIDQGFGYAGVQQVRDYLVSCGDEVILVDIGDAIQGEPIGPISKGEGIIRLMNTVGYELAVPGTHEFDYGMDQFLELTELASFPYLSANFNHDGKLMFEPYVIRELAGRRIAFVGVTTPKALTTSMPRYFQNVNGEFVYGFYQDVSGEELYAAVQKAVDAAREEGADYVVVLAHLGNEESCTPWTSTELIENTVGIDVLLDGHSHDAEQTTVTDKDGSKVFRSACGSRLSRIGYCRISAAGRITVGVFSWPNKISAPELLGIDNEAYEAVKAASASLDELLRQPIASSAAELTICDPETLDENGDPIPVIRCAETNMGDLVADAYRVQSGADIAFVNSSTICAGLPAGDVTPNDILRALPTGRSLCVVEANGRQIIDALEWASRFAPTEEDGFLQVSGLSYEVHTYIQNSTMYDEDSMFFGMKGPRRIKNVMVNGEPIDNDATYTLAAPDYMLLNCGDGFSMFRDCELIQDHVKVDSQVLIDFITENLGGKLGKEYSDPAGQGRIKVVRDLK